MLCFLWCCHTISPACFSLKNQTQNKREVVMLTTGLRSCLYQDSWGLNWLQFNIWASQAQARIYQRLQPHMFLSSININSVLGQLFMALGALEHISYCICVFVICFHNTICLQHRNTEHNQVNKNSYGFHASAARCCIVILNNCATASQDKTKCCIRGDAKTRQLKKSRQLQV